jgi:pilus assembly protein Flp/PilA
VFGLKKYNKVRELLDAETGTVSLEYGLIASLVALAALTGLTSVGNNLGTSFKAAADAILVSPDAGAPPPAAAPPTAAPTMAAPKAKAP